MQISDQVYRLKYISIKYGKYFGCAWILFLFCDWSGIPDIPNIF